MEEFKFNSLEELYKKILPALNTKVADLKRNNIKYINEENIWQYLRNNYWKKADKLSLGEIVHDILSTPNGELEEYVAKYKKYHKIQEKEEVL